MTYGNGRVQKITNWADPNYTTTYGYDEHNRLATASAPAFSRSYGYDAWGNLTNHTASGQGETGSYSPIYATNGTGAPLNNRINNAGYGYDAAGNLTTEGGASYTYDAANRMKTAGGVSNDYDGDGNRVKHANGSGTLFYLWSSVLGQPVAEVTSGGVYRAYVYGPGGGQMLAQQSYDGQFYWAHTDHLGSGRKLTNTSGTVVYRGEFDPHGQSLYEWHASGQTYLNSHKFTGYERDWATNLDHAKARTYTHNRGRFMQPDPLGLGAADATNPQSLNMYSYVGNDPVNFVDPSGMLPALTCMIDGMPASCSMAFGLLQSGAGVIGPLDTTRWNSGLNQGKGGFEHFRVGADGNAGWGYWSSVTGRGVDAAGNVLWSYTDTDWHWTKYLGTPGVSNGQLMFDLYGVTRDITGSIIGERPIEMQMLGPLDMIGVGEIKGAMVAGGLLLGGLQAFAKHFPKHHIFPQAQKLRPFFTNAGINIHDHTIRISKPLHDSLHGRGGGPWVNAWVKFFGNNPNAGPVEIYKYAGELLYRFKIPGGPIIPY